MCLLSHNCSSFPENAHHHAMSSTEHVLISLTHLRLSYDSDLGELRHGWGLVSNFSLTSAYSWYLALEYSKDGPHKKMCVQTVPIFH